MHRIEIIPCGEFVNERERKAAEHLKSRLKLGTAEQTWLLLSNVPSAVNDRAIPDEVDLIAIGPTGLFVIEIKHWDRTYMKSHAIAVEQEATKLNNKVRRIVGKLRRAGIDPGFVAGRFLLTNDTRAWDSNRPVVLGAEFFVLSEWKRLLQVEGATIFDEATIHRACEIIQPQARIALHGDVRHIAGIRNLERVGSADDRFHRIYRGEHVRSRDGVVLHLYDLSASDDPKADRIASREFDALQQLQRLACVPRLMDSFHDVPDYPRESWYFSLVDSCAPTDSQRCCDRKA